MKNPKDLLLSIIYEVATILNEGKKTSERFSAIENLKENADELELNHRLP